MNNKPKEEFRRIEFNPDETPLVDIEPLGLPRAISESRIHEIGMVEYHARRIAPRGAECYSASEVLIGKQWVQAFQFYRFRRK